MGNQKKKKKVAAWRSYSTNFFIAVLSCSTSLCFGGLIFNSTGVEWIVKIFTLLAALIGQLDIVSFDSCSVFVSVWLKRVLVHDVAG